MTARSIRIAIIGAGLMGEQIAAAAARLPNVSVTAVVDADITKAHTLAESVGAESATSLRDVAGLADGVYIGAPSHLHAALCIEAATAGLDILVDKPMCLSLDEADAVREAVERSKVRLMVGFSYRYRREWMVAKQWLADGEIGTPIMLVDSIFEASSHTPKWYWDPQQGGGVTQLQAHHSFDRLAWLLEDDLRVTAAASNGNSTTAETAVTILAKAEKGALVSIALGFSTSYSASPVATLLIQGSNGHVVIDSVARTATITTGGSRRVVSVAEDDWLPREVSSFVDMVRRDASSDAVPGWNQGMAAVRAAEAAQAFFG